ncbi:hypothetical protein NUU61_005199 [Penicillium alfredii]|uniref:Telomere replication protein EST3 n=1 Tax=Penicillium alfredii TaxID=1506179 RepID=A0A9W9F942_9EURO|nr:uncharacterized protein NUU61_005199 [Penicillium alfredii]KAJ5095843.1 hypothetical protein NUU61_005199 [Penicillium alfredii]
MNPASPWIATFIQQCLSSYVIPIAEDGIEVEDNGSSLNFSLRGFTREHGDEATLMDSENQIEAIVSRDARAAHQLGSPELRLSKGGPKKHMVELLDFKLVLPYSASISNIHLRVDRFRIDWARGSIKFVPTRKLKRNPTVKRLVEAAHQRREKAEPADGLNDLAKSPSARSIGSQHDQFIPPHVSQSSPQDVLESQQFFSQMQLKHHLGARERTSQVGRPSSNGSSDLLRHLATPSSASDPRLNPLRRPLLPQHLPLNGRLTPKKTNQVESNTLNRIETNENQDIRASQGPVTPIQRCQDAFNDITLAEAQTEELSSQIPAKAAVDGLTYERRALSPRIQLPEVPRDTQQTRKRDDQFPSKKRARESVDILSQSPSNEDRDPGDLRESQSTSPSKKRQRTGAGKISTDPGIENNLVHKPIPPVHEMPNLIPKAEILPPMSDAWEGLLTIPASDVVIQKDQSALLDRFCWIPPNTGDPMPQGHVPPALLRQWNELAQRRHNQMQRASEQSPTPTPQEILSSATDSESQVTSWSSSTEGHYNQTGLNERTGLPADSSPIRPPNFTNEDITPIASQHDATQPAENGGLGMADEFPERSQLEPEKILDKGPDASKSLDSLHSGTGTSQYTLAHLAQHSDDGTAQTRRDSQFFAADSEEYPLQIETQTENLENSALKKNSRRGSRSSEAAAGFHENDLDDESDESEMDACVPMALGGSSSYPTLSTQTGQEINSSGPSLPEPSRQHVQVAETPCTDNMRLQREKLEKAQAGGKPSILLQQGSSQAAKTSSQPRIFNSYRSNGSLEKSDSSHPSTDSFLQPSGNKSPRIDVIGTQIPLGSGNSLSQDASLHSQPGIVLDSSELLHRYQDPLMLGLENEAEPSSFPLISPREPPMSQLVDPSQDPMEGLSSLGGSIGSPQNFLIRSAPALRDQEQSPSKLPRSRQLREADPGRAFSGSPNAELVARRESFIGNPDESAEAKRVYEKFRDDYPSYSGDFAHFTELCSQLQAVRDRGHLQRSFLWDDFVIMHLLEYPDHVEGHTSQESKPLFYEEYFSLNFSKPQHKKRSLTAYGIEVSASQFVPAVSTGLASNSPAPPFSSEPRIDITNHTLTTSFVGKLSNLRTHSFSDTRATTSAVNASPALPARADTDIFQTQQPLSAVDSSGPTGSQAFEPSSFDQETVFSSSNEEQDDKALHQDSNDVDGANVLPTSNDVDMAEDDNSEASNTHHETASIELGGDESAAASGSDVDTEPESENENWFLSLRHMRPAGPVWSDDPNTPFKIWARADQNVVSERCRRGGSIPVDENGVIQRPFSSNGPVRLDVISPGIHKLLDLFCVHSQAPRSR